MPAITYLDLKNKVLGHLQKETGYQGFFTDQKLQQAINESIDFAESIMFFEGSGWNREVLTIANAANVSNIALPDNIAVLDRILFKSDDGSYYPLVYSDMKDEGTDSITGVSQPYRVSLMKQTLYFEPKLANAGTDNIKIYCRTMSQNLASDSAILDPQFNKTIVNYICFRAAGQLADICGLGPSYFSKREDEWYAAFLRVVGQKNRTVTRVKDFNDC
jgi:hypothetical protein